MDAVSELVYHYTTGDGLISILKSRKLWATDVAHLNDLEEFELAFLDVTELLSDVSSDVAVVSQTGDDGGLNSARFNLLDYPSGTRFGPFVTCFCKDGDLLSQWRGYARGGYAIGFNRSQLEALPDWEDGTSTPLVEVQYGTAGKLNVLDSLRSELHELALAGRSGDAMFAAMRAAVTVKDEGFREEDELRLIAVPKQENREHFRAKPSGAVVPYIEVGFPQSAVREIVIGPGAFDRSDLRAPTRYEGGELPRLHPAVDAVHRLARKFDYRGLSVRTSAIPYRG